MGRPSHGTGTDTGGHTTVAIGMARGLLMLSLLLMLRLSPGTMVDMDTAGHTMATSMARGPLMLSLLLMLRLSPGTMVDMDTPGHTMEPTADAKAEPWWYGGYGYGYAWPHYGGYYYGKRSADAEPTADAKAEPWWYGGYGYAWPHYGVYYYGK